jgi:hypothetical protein
VNRLGGVFTVNWHDRSIVPERLWDTFYINLLDDLKRRGAWFSTVSQAVAWFRMRRSVVMEIVSKDGVPETVKLSVNRNDNLPGLRIRIHKAQSATGTAAEPAPQIVEIPFLEDVEVPLAAPICA